MRVNNLFFTRIRPLILVVPFFGEKLWGRLRIFLRFNYQRFLKRFSTD